MKGIDEKTAEFELLDVSTGHEGAITCDLQQVHQC